MSHSSQAVNADPNFSYTRFSKTAVEFEIMPTLPWNNSSSHSEAASLLAAQWQNPNDVLTILLIIGGDIVQKAIAQLAGSRFVPVSFSFGWVNYSFFALIAAFGNGSLMPTAADASILINAESRYARKSTSWILEQILRSVENDAKSHAAPLRVSIYNIKPVTSGVVRDYHWWSGVAVMLLQLALSAVPCLVNGDWTLLLITAVGIHLAVFQGSLPQWKMEKWHYRSVKKRQTYCLTRGNGTRHVAVLFSEPPAGPCLEDLAVPRRGCSPGSQMAVALLAILWILFLITVAGLRQNAWYLLAIGSIGMVQNVFVAAIPRRPEALRLPLKPARDSIAEAKVMATLIKTEVMLPTVGACLVPIFFPGPLREYEKFFWENSAATGKMKFPLDEAD